MHADENDKRKFLGTYLVGALDRGTLLLLAPALGSFGAASPGRHLPLVARLVLVGLGQVGGLVRLRQRVEGAGEELVQLLGGEAGVVACEREE